MCGIYGHIKKGELGLEELNGEIQLQVKKLAHRGPDSSAVVTGQKDSYSFGLGHTRLSIQGLGKAGDQPMSHKSHTIVFNGEIYNALELASKYPKATENLVSASDTEILLRLWGEYGPEILGELRGIFAFAIFDSKKDSIILVRDVFGVKPLYFSQNDGELTFSSEPQLLKKSDDTGDWIDESSAVRYLAYSKYDTGSQTFFSGVKRVAGGTAVEFDLKNLQIKATTISFFRVAIREPTKLSMDAAAVKLRAKFLSAVERNLVSDVPVSFALSGGLDSSAIVSAVRFLKPKMEINVFSYIPEDASLSEERYSRALSAEKQLIYHPVELTQDLIEEHVEEFVQAQGEPVSSSRMMAQFMVFKKAASNGFKVMIEGQGADEVLAGYHGFIYERLAELIKKGHLIHALNLYDKWKQNNVSYGSLLPVAMAASNFLTRNFAQSSLHGWARSRFARDDGLEAVLKDTEFRALGHKRFLDASLPKSAGFVNGLAEATYETYLPQLLRQGDRSAMFHSVENRVPFLDEDFVDFAWTLPSSYLLSEDGETKAIFRRAMKGLVPDFILERKDKVGFQTDSWLRFPTKTGGENQHQLPYLADLRGRSADFRWRVDNLKYWMGL